MHKCLLSDHSVILIVAVVSIPQLAIRTELERFIAGEELEDLPQVVEEMDALRWVQCVERSVEALHSRIHKATANAANTSVPAVSLSMRLPEIKDIVSTAAGLVEFAEICSSVRSARQIEHEQNNSSTI